MEVETVLTVPHGLEVRGMVSQEIATNATHDVTTCMTYRWLHESIAENYQEMFTLHMKVIYDSNCSKCKESTNCKKEPRNCQSSTHIHNQYPHSIHGLHPWVRYFLNPHSRNEEVLLGRIRANFHLGVHCGWARFFNVCFFSTSYHTFQVRPLFPKRTIHHIRSQ